MAHAFHRISNILKRKEKMRVILTGLEGVDKKDIYGKLNSHDAAISTPMASQNVKLVMIGFKDNSYSRLARDGLTYLDKPIKFEEIKGLIFLVDATSRATLPAASDALKVLLDDHSLHRLPLLVYGLVSRGQRQEVSREYIIERLNLQRWPTLVYQVFLINWDSISYFYDGISWLIYRIQNPNIDTSPTPPPT